MTETAIPGMEKRQTLRETQRQVTRARILSAARDLFGLHSYLVVSSNDLAAAAGVSRATFYLHFRGKEGVLEAVLAEDLEHQLGWIQSLGEMPVPSRASIAIWVTQLFKGARDRQSSTQLFSLMNGLDPNYRSLMTARRDLYIDILAERHPAFLLPGDPALREKRRTEIHMLFYELDQLAFHLAWPGCALDHDAGVEEAIATVERFLASRSC